MPQMPQDGPTPAQSNAPDAASPPVTAGAALDAARVGASSRPGQGAATVELIALAQLWADQFRHLATVGVAAAGGVLILMQSQLIEVQTKWWLALGLFATGAVLAMQGQMGVVDGATAGKPPGRSARIVRAMAAASLGGGGGLVIGILTSG
ncbi:hypothetical protein H0E84_15460 [Luteimonas sp. SJ-92]|uniref:Uncharacterized protein n=1 Tax=Luteimonas salinisoli TaxID=2752307 RepID=A0A853JFZ8_9GAMM|nr:hypothetical protein [Luteimonas salinisoli]NZA27775.1 hypothetical protein [Luteimonas salinisoli]